MTAALARMPKRVPDWHDMAACRLFSELDWITPGGPNASAERRAAAELACRTVCAVCPVRLKCAVGALERRERWGIWGGLDYEDRKLVAARFGYEPPGDPPEHGTNARRVKWGCACFDCRRAHALYEAIRREGKRREAGKDAPAPVVVVAPPKVPKPRRTGPSPATLEFRRKVVALRREGLDAHAIAARLGCHRNTVWEHLRAAKRDQPARRRLRLNLGEYDRRRRARARRR